MADNADTTADKHFIVAAALDGAGWHPAAWREPSSRPEALFTPGYWVERTREAESGGLDFVTFEDGFALQSSDRFLADDRTDEVRGRLDARLIASRVAPATQHLGLVPVVNTTLTEPFHQSKAIATLDFASLGRAGFQARVGSRAEEFTQLGIPDDADLAAVRGASGTGQGPDPELSERLSRAIRERFDRGADEVHAIRLLWDSWEDGAEIRDVQTDRFIDTDLLHTVDFVAESFSVRGPSITPRPPQGQPLVTALAHADIPYEFAARAADVVFVTPAHGNAEAVLQSVRAAESRVGRDGEPLRVVADLVVALDETAGAQGPTGEAAADRLARLDSLGRPLAEATEARVVAGSAAHVADVIEELSGLGYDGVRLRPAVLTDDLPRISADLAPELRRRGLARETYPDDASLRGLVGLPTQVPNRFAGRTGQNSPAPASAL